MSKTKKKNDLLSSWKEIASYLDCDVRTAHRWEKEYALPVHRLGKGSRARVFAYEHELEAWLRRKAESGPAQKSTSLLFATLIAAAIILILGGTGVFIYQSFIFDRTPYDFNIENLELIILNKDGRELWRHDFYLNTNLDKNYYKERFQERTVVGQRVNLPAIQFKDINQDGRIEVLFPIVNEPDGRFFCFSDKGDILWRIQSGREMTFGSKIYGGRYRTNRFRTVDLDGDGFLEIVMCSDHSFEFPTQMLVVNHQGEILNEYWHSGRIHDIYFYDVNKDNRLDIIIGGVNNQFDAPFIAVFDQDNISGASPNTGEYACPALEPGSEKYYIRLPLTETALIDEVHEVLGYLRLISEQVFAFRTYPTSLLYRFNSRFRLLEIRDSHTFEKLFRKAKEQGRIGDIMRQDYVSSLKGRVLWHDGEKWAAEPAMRNDWDN